MNFTTQYGDDLKNVLYSLNKSVIYGYKYIRTVIDVFSKYGWSVPLETKTGKEVGLAFWKLFLANTAPSRLWTDKGTGFYNQQLNAVLAANNVTLYSSIMERWNRTMKNIMWNYFAANNTQQYIDVLPSMVEKYNNTYHLSNKLTLSDARISAKVSTRK